jgi:hypothetical protein
VSLVVVYLRKEVATPFGRHIKQAPQGVDQIPGAMVLISDGWHETHLGAPKVTDRSVRSLDSEDASWFASDFMVFKLKNKPVGEQPVS